MRGLLAEQPDGPVVWFGLGQDVEGVCDGCARRRPMYAEYRPTDAWLCKPCFRESLEDMAAL